MLQLSNMNNLLAEIDLAVSNWEPFRVRKGASETDVSRMLLRWPGLCGEYLDFLRFMGLGYGSFLADFYYRVDEVWGVNERHARNLEDDLVDPDLAEVFDVSGMREGVDGDGNILRYDCKFFVPFTLISRDRGFMFVDGCELQEFDDTFACAGHPVGFMSFLRQELREYERLFQEMPVKPKYGEL